ncbi:MAG: nitroreductase family protein [Candidatus Thorarchaeota archaeon]
MESYEHLIKRLEIRDFDEEKEIPEDLIRKVVEAGRLAPSAMNRQPWRFMIIREKDRLKKLASIKSSARFVGKAGFAVAIYVKETRFSVIDATRAISTMQFAAWALDPPIGSCFNFGWEEEKVAEILGAIDGFILFTIIPFGYPQNPKIVGKKKRLPWSEVIIDSFD